MRFALALCLALAGCGSSSSDSLGAGSTDVTPSCDVGSTRECACPTTTAGAHGAQKCSAQSGGGALWSECACPDAGAPDAATDTSSVDAPGDVAAEACGTPAECAGCTPLPAFAACPSPDKAYANDCPRGTPATCFDFSGVICCHE